MDADTIVAGRHGCQKRNDLDRRIASEGVERQGAVLSAAPAQNNRFDHRILCVDAPRCTGSYILGVPTRRGIYWPCVAGLLGLVAPAGAQDTVARRLPPVVTVTRDVGRSP